ncbi:TonB-dependent receptor [Pseudomonas helleri]|jgi:iron complex outermembrane receptor protein|uniref:TonB-dependent siderophore receptor n=1 Tax=Pseudomonas helleri TaxID=1608996 RepID=UPI002F35038C
MGYVRASRLALGVALSIVGSAGLSTAWADGQALGRVAHFELPTGPLDQVLLTISRQGAVPISFEQRLLHGLKSAPVSGDLTASEAIDQALRGTGLHRVQSDIGLSVQADAPTDSTTPQLKTVTVTGQKVEQPKIIAGALGSASELDTPFSTRQVSSAEIEERQIKALGKVFSEDTSVVSNGDTFSLNAYSISVRGLPLDDGGSYKINGLPIYMTTVELPLEAFDSVQLLKGASGFMYGFGAPGGVINFVTKKPTDETTLSVDAGMRSNGVYSEHVDTGGRVGADDTFGYRLNAVHEEGETYSHSNVHRDSASLSLDARITPDLTWTADTLYQERRINGGIQDFDLSSYTGDKLPKPISGRTDFSAFDDTFFQSRIWLAATGLHWNVTPDWSASVDYSHFSDKRVYAAEWMSLLDKAGNFRDNLNVGHSIAIYDQVQAMAQGSFSTGPIDHKAVFGVSWQGLTRRSSLNYLSADIGGNNLYDTPDRLTYDGSFDYSTYRTAYIDQRAVFASDTLDLTHGWSLLAGLRLTDYTQDTYGKSGSRTSTYHETPLTPTVALMYKPRPDTTFYASYVEALESGGTAGITYKNANEVLDPIKSKQYEVGVKTDRKNWGGSAAVFRIERGAEYGNSQNYYVQDGEQRYQGVELNGHLDVTDNTTLSSSSTWLDATFTKNEDDLVGNRVSGVPRFQQVVQVSHKVAGIEGLKVYADAHYTGSSEADDNNTWKLPEYTLYGVGASYRLKVDNHNVTLRGAVDNLTDHKYWGILSSDYIFVGAPRTLSLNVSFDL